MSVSLFKELKWWLWAVKQSELLLDPSQVPGSELVLLAEGHLQRAAVPVRAVVDLVVRMFDGMFEKLRRGRLQTSPAVQGPDLAPGHDGRGLKLRRSDQNSLWVDLI